MFLTACNGNVIIANDPHDECAHPQKPPKPYADKATAIFVAEQSKAINKCRALLGK